MEFITVIRDECGCVVVICKEHSEEEINEILSNHPEWNRSIIMVE